jgi:lysophospholipase L1-like esterase
VRQVPHLTVQSVPGLTLAKAFESMCLGKLNVDKFELVLVSVGSNDMEGKDIDYVVTRTRAIIRYMQQAHPRIKLAISTIIPRTGMSCEKKRVDINSFIKRICKDLGIPYLTPLKNVLASQLQASGLYALDNIHLNDNGVSELRSFYIGATAAHLINTPGQKSRAT